MTTKTKESDTGDSLVTISLREFLEEAPPGQRRIVSNVKIDREHFKGWYIRLPEIHRYCSEEECDGIRIYHAKETPFLSSGKNDKILEYVCKNCSKSGSTKTFAVRMFVEENKTVTALKYGEIPSFGQPTPRRVLRLLGDHKINFLKGRRCENQGLGKGAFTYYRNVVEAQRNAVVDQIIKVAEIQEMDTVNINTLRSAKRTKSFSESIKIIGDLLPTSLQIMSQNPLTLLHRNISEGVHPRLSDADCLKRATAIRTVLLKLCEKVTEIQREYDELKSAIGTLT